jgi:hypothetical protein
MFSFGACIHFEPFLADHKANNFMLLRSKMRRLLPVHQASLKALLEHLSRVVAFAEKNKMDAKNIAIVLGTAIFGEDEIPKNGDLLSVQAYKVTILISKFCWCLVLKICGHPNRTL